ncbi:T4S1 protein, partial [Atractosteus spatula]|nr:T4S1 protein [Atractosteus spatula]
MCSRSCAQCIGYTLMPLAVCCIVANILLYFPDGDATYAKDGHLTTYVWFFAGIVGGGVLMFLPAGVFICLGDYECCDCCGHRGCGECCAMLGSILVALIGALGSAYCFIVSAIALTIGPLCYTQQNWKYPFENETGEYLTNFNSWSTCEKPKNVVVWNVSLFSILLGLSGIEFLMCAMQVINGLVGAICGPCCNRQQYAMNKA